jgi:hypothetical protein
MLAVQIDNRLLAVRNRRGFPGWGFLRADSSEQLFIAY